MLTGFVMPLLFLPGFINQSLGITMVSAISEAKAQNNLRLIKRRLNQAIGVALIIGAPSTILMYLYAPELMTVIYHSPAAAPFLKLIAPFFLLNYLQTPLQSVLIGMGQAKTAMINNIIAKCRSVALIYPLASNPKLGINGVIIAISMGVILETILHYSSVVKLIGFTLDISNVIKILTAGIAMGYIGRVLFTQLDYFSLQFGSSNDYVVLLGFLRVIHQNNVVKIPVIGRILALLFPK